MARRRSHCACSECQGGVLYAPLSDVGNIIYDKDAMYIQLHDVQFSKAEDLDQTADDAHRGRAGDGPGSSSDEDGGGNSNGAIGPAVPPTEGQKMVHSLQGLGADGASSGHMDDALNEAKVIIQQVELCAKMKARRPYLKGVNLTAHNENAGLTLTVGSSENNDDSDSDSSHDGGDSDW